MPVIDRRASWLKRIWRSLRETQPFNGVAALFLRQLARIFPSACDPIAEHLPYIGLVRHSLPNGRALVLRSYGDDYLVNQIFWKQEYEPETSSVLFRLAESADCIFDIGAHVGFYSLLAAQANPRASIHAFEPLPKIYQRLCENVRINGLNQIRCVASAAGKKNGTAEIFFLASSEISSDSSLKKKNSAELSDRYASLTIPVTTLDHYADEHGVGRIDLVKMDTEGTEVDVLLGMTGMMERDHPTIICEVLPGIGDAEALERLLTPLGYRYYLLTGTGPMPRQKIEGHSSWRNYLFVRGPVAELGLG